MSINSLAISEREQFFHEHGDRVFIDGTFIFEDGATTEESPMSLLSPPPQDDWERAKLVTKYHEVVAQNATTDFEEYKSYLKGLGKRRDEWAKLYTDEEQLAFLRELQVEARRCRARFARHRRELDRLTPEWLKQDEQADIDNQTRRAEFSSAVDSVKL